MTEQDLIVKAHQAINNTQLPCLSCCSENFHLQRISFDSKKYYSGLRKSFAKAQLILNTILYMVDFPGNITYLIILVRASKVLYSTDEVPYERGT
jgi:hypothetical protein